MCAVVDWFATASPKGKLYEQFGNTTIGNPLVEVKADSNNAASVNDFGSINIGATLLKNTIDKVIGPKTAASVASCRAIFDAD